MTRKSYKRYWLTFVDWKDLDLEDRYQFTRLQDAVIALDGFYHHYDASGAKVAAWIFDAKEAKQILFVTINI